MSFHRWTGPSSEKDLHQMGQQAPDEGNARLQRYRLLCKCTFVEKNVKKLITSPRNWMASFW